MTQARDDSNQRDTDEAAIDRALMARMQSGEEAALGVLMERWELPVKSVIARLVLNASEAEELAQETFVRVWQQREKFRAGAAVRPWLLAIAVNLARNRLRWWRRRPVVSLDAWSETHETPDPRQATAPATAEKTELGAAVRAAIAALPADLREAIVLSEYEHLSHAEIAAVVGATTKAVETRIYRAKEKLRLALRRWM